MAFCISTGPLADALASSKDGSAASMPSRDSRTRSTTLTLSVGATDAGSDEQVFRWRRNAEMSSVEILAMSNAGASTPPYGFPEGRPSATPYLTVISGAGAGGLAGGDEACSDGVGCCASVP